uniref:Uncharacterized protein n=1 Tax=Alexandrium andersonii TaxID=327968 RepID=A0A7S2IPB8_9DINO
MEQPKVRQTFDAYGCKIKCAVAASLNVSGLSSLALGDVTCDGGECLETVHGVCTKWRASLAVSFAADELAISGFGDADLRFRGRCSFFKHLPDIPHFQTTARIVKPQVSMQLSAVISLTPPSISEASFALTSLTYEELADFECGIHWFPAINGICNDYAETIIQQCKDLVLSMANSGLQTQEGALQTQIEGASPPA